MPKKVFEAWRRQCYRIEHGRGVGVPQAMEIDPFFLCQGRAQSSVMAEEKGS